MADTLRFIKELKPELREKLIYREYIRRKYREKKAQGWEEVHKALKSAPYCDRFQQISKTCNYPYCEICGDIYRCDLCEKKTRNGHHLTYSGLEKCFMRIYHNTGLCSGFIDYYNQSGYYNQSN